MRTVPLHAWHGVSLLALVADEADPLVAERLELAFLFPDLDLWRADAIFDNWRLRANERYRRAHALSERAAHAVTRPAKRAARRGPTARASEATRAHGDTLTTWAAETRAIADDVAVVYGDRLAAVLRRAAADVDESVRWAEQRIAPAPRDPRGRADLFLAIELWAFDEVRGALEAAVLGAGAPVMRAGLPSATRGRALFLQPALAWLEEAGAKIVTTDEAWLSRVKALRVKPGQEAALVADVLSACRTGPTDRDGLTKK